MVLSILDSHCRLSVIFDVTTAQIRAGKYLEEPVGKSSTRSTSLKMSMGWLNCNAVYTCAIS